MEEIRAFAPATVANVGCGFDVLGFALNYPGDEVLLRTRQDNKLIIADISGDHGLLPRKIEENTVSLVIIEYLKHIGKADFGLSIYLEKKMPLKSGLGSSAASSVVGVYALNEMLGRPLQPIELLPFVMKGEALACGVAHADNVAPALLGGFVLVRDHSTFDVIQLPTPDDLWCTVVHPDITVQTKDARSILRKRIALNDAVTQWANLGGLIAGLYTEDYDLIGRSLTDVIVEPNRSILIPGFRSAKSAALSAGALGCSISGSGPSMFALSKGERTALLVGEAFQNVFTNLGIHSQHYVSKINHQGPRILTKA